MANRTIVRSTTPAKSVRPCSRTGGNAWPWVGIDALAIRRAQVQAARQAIQEQCGIPPGAVLIAASHSHSSGPTAMILPGEYDHASQEVQELAYEKSSCADADYLEHVVRQIVAAVVQADENRVPARCGVGSGHEDQVAFNAASARTASTTNLDAPQQKLQETSP